MSRQDYEIVMGLEVHAELSTKTKIVLFLSNRIWRRTKYTLLSYMYGNARYTSSVK